MRSIPLTLLLLLCVAAAGCSSRILDREDESLPVYRLDDGSLCKAPADFERLAQSPGTRQLRSLFLSSTPPEDVVAMIPELPDNDALEAALYLSCGEFARGELSTPVFTRQRRITQEFRQARMLRGIDEWLEKDDGFVMAGKVCHFIFDGTNPDSRNLTRMVPGETTVDDCAIHVFDNGGTHLLLGCSAGRWKIDWAAQPLLVAPNGWANRRRSVLGTQYVPEADCGWQ